MGPRADRQVLDVGDDIAAIEHATSITAFYLIVVGHTHPGALKSPLVRDGKELC